jgi:phosphoribosylformylglycinamidine cyclo-ligase
VLNKVGAFASLFDIGFPALRRPVLVCKTEEPGSKQKLSIANGKIEDICFDMINHLTNDILVMGATPLAVQDAVICGKLEPETVSRLVKGIARACRENGSVLTGGETSEQPDVINAGTYILTSSIIGIAERDDVIDGAEIEAGDVVLALPSNGIHTNGYSFLRMMMARDGGLRDADVHGERFLDVILLPHRAYYKELIPLFGLPADGAAAGDAHPLRRDLKGMAHITGGGIGGNLNRILPAGLDAEINLSALRVPPIFRFIKERSGAEDGELLRTFNMGAGMTVAVRRGAENRFIEHFEAAGCGAYVLGEIKAHGNRSVRYTGALNTRG